MRACSFVQLRAVRPGLCAMGKRGANKVAEQQQKKQRSMIERLQKQNLQRMEMTQESSLQRLVEKLRPRPEVAAHILELLECGSYDHVDSNGSVEKLPVSTKKFHLLSKKVIQDILLKLMPSLKEVLELFPAKTPKSDFTTWLCYVLHCSPESAVPTKSMPDLLTWCQKQWEDNGKRGVLSDDSRQALLEAGDEQDLETFLDSEFEGYWFISDSGKLT